MENHEDRSEFRHLEEGDWVARVNHARDRLRASDLLVLRAIVRNVAACFGNNARIGFARFGFV